MASGNELRLNIKLRSQRGEPTMAAGLSLAMDDAPSPAETEAIRKEELRKQQDKREELELARMQAAKRQGSAPGSG